MLYVCTLKYQFSKENLHSGRTEPPQTSTLLSTARVKSKIRVLADAVPKENASWLVYSHLLILSSQHARGLIFVLYTILPFV